MAPSFDDLREQYFDPYNDPVDRCGAIIEMGTQHAGLPDTLEFYELLARKAESWTLDIHEAYALAQGLPPVCERCAHAFKVVSALASFPASNPISQNDCIYLFKLLREGLSRIDQASPAFSDTAFAEAVEALKAANRREQSRNSDHYADRQRFLREEAGHLARLRDGKVLRVARAAGTAAGVALGLFAAFFQLLAGFFDRR